MQFFDKVIVKCSSGAGGDGCVAARREKYIPYGGPAGGNGGDGGTIWLFGDAQLTTLAPLHAMKHIKAPAGEAGKIKEQYGKNAEDVLIHVPLGTIVTDVITGEEVARINYTDQKVLLLSGGRGGVGNMHFSNSVTQYANFCLLGEPGQSKEFVFELQLLADVALLGFPSVGKTSLLNTVSAADAKTAPYHFTTLIPNLGVVHDVPAPFVMIDIPGLISGAAEGKGLGNEFLRHVLKARIWNLVFDMSAYEQGIQVLRDLLDEVREYIDKIVFPKTKLQQQLIATPHGLIRSGKDQEGNMVFEKYCIFSGNKIDMVRDEEVRQALVEELIGMIIEHPLGKKLTPIEIEKNVFLVSAASQEGITTRCNALCTRLSHMQISLEPTSTPIQSAPPRTRTQIDQLRVAEVTDQWLSWLIENDYLEEKEKKYVYVWDVAHPEMSYLTYVLPWGNDEAEFWYWRVLEKKQVLKELERQGVKKGDVFLVRSPYAGKEDRWIRWI